MYTMRGINCDIFKNKTQITDTHRFSDKQPSVICKSAKNLLSVPLVECTNLSRFQYNTGTMSAIITATVKIQKGNCLFSTMQGYFFAPYF